MNSGTDLSTPSQGPDAHADFIKTQLPTWLAEAAADIRAALRDSLLKSNRSRHQLRAILERIQSPEAFALPLLEKALKSEYLTLLNAKTSILVREWKASHLLGLLHTHARTTEQSLLEAALQNFEASEAQDGGMDGGSGIFNQSPSGRIDTLQSPTLFADFCRRLNLGEKYLSHIRAVIKSRAAFPGYFREHEQHRLAVAAHLAYLKGDLAQTLYENLASLTEHGHHIGLTCSHLTVDGVVLPSVVVFYDTRATTQPILYTPEDPVAAIRLHTTMQELETQLATRLMQPQYLAFFKGLAPVHLRESLLAVKPSWIDWLPVGSPGKIRPASLEKPLTLTGITGNLFHAIALRRFAQIESDACAVAVPTAQADIVSRQKRLQFYIDLGKSLLFFAASFVPIVGEVLLVVTGAQLIGTVYNGFAAWSRGDSQTALNDLLDVIDNVAMAVATAGVIKAGRFTAGLVKVQVRNQGWRLWHSDLEPYRHPDALPSHLPPDSQGLYQQGGQHYVKLDDQLHGVQRAPDGEQWELSHPTDPKAYAPPLLSNASGGWRHLHETPTDWDNLKLIKRLGPDAANITQPDVESILLLSGVDTRALRQAHQEMVRPPPLLRDTVKDFNLDQEINAFNMDRAEGAAVTAHSPLIQFHLLGSLPEWPSSYVLKVVDEQQNSLLSFGSGSREINVSDARFRRGELLHVVQEQMPPTEFNALLPTPFIDYFTKTENLAMVLTEQLSQKRQWLFSQLKAASDTTVTPAEKSIRALLPQLSKSQLEEIEPTLTQAEQQNLQKGEGLPATQLMEANEYRAVTTATRLNSSVFLESLRSHESVPMVLYTLEQIPGWPAAHRFELYDGSPEGPLLGSIGGAGASERHVLVREGERYTVHDAQDAQPCYPLPLPAALEQTLSPTERSTLFSQSGTASVEQALHSTGQRLLARRQVPCRAMPPLPQAPNAAGLPLDPLFAEASPPTGLTVRTDTLHQAPLLTDGSFRDYIKDNEKYYRVKRDPLGYRLIDARSPFRFYQPYVRNKAGGGWEIDPAKGKLLGGAGSPAPSHESMESSDAFESAHSSSPYASAEESLVNVQYTPQELTHMRTLRSYQHSQNYRGIYDRANNGRYPLRDEQGRPARIRLLQSQGKSLTSDKVYASSLLRPFIQWDGYENVAIHYEDKLEVVPFTAAHQEFPQEAALIGQATVISRRPLAKGEALGAYGGEMLPLYVAKARRDPYLIAIKDVRPTTPFAVNTQLVLSGDNALSRINTIFEYDAAGFPTRQASTGYNVEAAQFRVQTQTGSAPQEQLILTGLFAGEDIAAGAELRWNYQYDETTIRDLFPRP